VAVLSHELWQRAFGGDRAIVGRSIDVLEGQQVEVLVPELDGRLGVDVVSTSPEAA